MTALAVFTVFSAFLLVGLYAYIANAATGAELCSGVSCPSEEVCKWGNCVKNAFSNITESYIDTGAQCVAYAICASFDSRRRCERWITAPPCSAGPFPFPLPVNYKPECLYSINVTEMVSDDTGRICSDGVCGVPGSPLPSPSPPPGPEPPQPEPIISPSLAVAKPTFSITGFATAYEKGFGTHIESVDITNFFTDRANPRISLEVVDTQPAQRSGETTRSISAKLKMLVLNPSPTQKCVPGPGGRPILAPLCAGTTASCTMTPSETNPRTGTAFTSVQCIDVGQFNGYYDSGSALACNGNYIASFLTQQQRAYTCTKAVGDLTFSKYGSYSSFGFSVTGTRTTPTNLQLCPLGCSGGFCIGNRPPGLTSITAAPRRVGVNNFTINMTSVAADLDTVTTGTGSRRQQIKLECGTAPGNISRGAGGGGGGGVYPNSCGPVNEASVLAILNKYPATNVGIQQALPELQSAFGPQVRILDHPIRLDKIDFGNGYIVDVIVGATGTSGTWGWIPESNCGISPTALPMTGFATGSGQCGTGGFVDRLSGYDTTRLFDCTQTTTKYVAGRVFSNFDPAGGVTQSVIDALKADGLNPTRISNDVIDFADVSEGAVVGKIDVILNCCSLNSNWQWSPVSGGGGGGGGGGTTQTGSFNANLCSGSLADANPNCTITRMPTEWSSGGQKNIYCRAKDESGLYSEARNTSIVIDRTPPTSVITSPPARSVRSANFAVTATDSDDSGFGTCYYTASSDGDTTARPNKNILITNPYAVWRPMDIAYSTRADAALAVWNWNPSGGGGGAAGQFINGDGTLRGGNIVLGSPGAFNGGIKIAYDEDDDLFLVVWGTATGSSPGPARGSLIKPDGTFVKTDFAIAQTCAIGARDSSMRNIAYSKTSRKFYVPCADSATIGTNVMVTPVSPDGTVGSTVIVASNGGAPSVAAGPATLLVTWSDSNGIVMGRLLDYRNNFVTPQGSISSTSAPQHVAFYNPVRGEYDVLYGSFGVRARTVKQDGTRGNEIQLPLGPNPFIGFSDAVYNPGTGSYFIAGEHSTDNGNSYYEIKGDGSVTLPAPVAEDLTQPNYVPAITSANGIPLTMMNRAGNAYVQFGPLSGTVPGNAKTRQCGSGNTTSQFTIKVGPGGDCPRQGDCTVDVFATDIFGNTGVPDSRVYYVQLVSSNITAPLAGSYQTANFTVSVVDKNFLGNSTSMACTYDIYSIGAGIAKTVDNAPRNCNSNFTVTVGPGEDCSAMGQNTCKILTKVNNGLAEGTDSVFVSIDWITPESRIVSAPTNWVTSDFTISVTDNPKGSVITECQYRVVSNGVETVRWTNRTCSSGPMPLTITVGAGKNCRNEGGAACTIFVRPLDRSRRPGFNDSVSVPVILSGNVTDINGFSSNLAITTDRGINFSGVTRRELRAATFYVCSSASSPADCIAAYTGGSSGVGRPNLCGSFANKCELRCGDRAISYYLAAKGVPIGEFNTVTVISPIGTGACPALNIAELNRLLALFQQLDEDISIQIMMVETFIRQNGETGTANNDTLQLLNEALLLVRDHLDYMNVTMQDMTITRSNQIMQKSNEVLDKINAIVRGIVPPVFVRLNVDMPASIRINRANVLNAVVTYSGPRPAYGRVFCTVTKPDRTAVSDSTSCQLFGNGAAQTTDLPIQFLPDRLGEWSYSCHITRSVRQDCSFEVEQAPVSGTFGVLPGLNLYIQSISSPGNVLKSRQADVTATVINPDEIVKFASVTCDFTDPDGFIRRNTSACVQVGGSDSLPVSVKQVVNKVGLWLVGGCTVRSSQSDNCLASALDNLSREVKNFSVVLPDDIFIESVTLPQSPVINGTPVTIFANVFNPLSSAYYVIASCDVSSPMGPVVLEDRGGIETGTTRTFMLNRTLDAPGTWTVTKCTASKSPNPDFSGAVPTHSVDSLGSISVITGINLTMTSISIPPQVQNGTTAVIRASVINPSTSRYGRVSCSIRNPLNQLNVLSSGCVFVAEDSVVEFPVQVPINRNGVWNVDSCSVFGSLNPDCSQAVLHGTRMSPGSMEAVLAPVPPGTQLFVQSISTSNTQINSNINVLVSVKSPNTANSTYGIVGCKFVDPFSIETLRASSCGQIAPNSTRQFIVSAVASSPGVWTVHNCFVNASATNTCSLSALHNVSAETRTLNVTTPNDLYIVRVDAPDNDMANNSNVPIDITVTNSFSDDKFGFVSCTIADPNGRAQTKTASCAPVPRQATRHYNVSVFADVVGTWNVKSCAVSSSSSSICAGATVTNEMLNGDVFNIIRGYNLTISPFSVPSPIYVYRPADFTYTLWNPSSTERFGRVTCTFTRSGQTVVNRSGCFLLSPESFVNAKTTLVPDTVGAWNVACTAERSFDASCSSPEVQDILSRGFAVLQPPDLYIRALNMPEVVAKDKESRLLLTIKNPVQSTVYGFAGCTFMNRLNETTRNTSSCINMSEDETTVSLGITPALRGNWSVSGCFVNVSLSTSCNQSRTHNVSTVSKSFAVTAPLLTVDGNISLVSENLFVGDVADIAVSVKNIGERDYFSFVNCTLISPTNIVYKLTTPNQSVPLNEVVTFHLQRVVDVAGTWKVGTCSVFRISSIILEEQQNINKLFDVQYIPSTDQCNNNIPCESGFQCVNGVCVAGQCSASTCPGIDSACYCLGSDCIACGSGFTCLNGRCVPEVPINACSSSRECGPNFECINGLCQQKVVECYADADCASDRQCIDGRCLLPEAPPVDSNIILFLIIILAVILIPVILFIYIRRAL